MISTKRLLIGVHTYTHRPFTIFLSFLFVMISHIIPRRRRPQGANSERIMNDYRWILIIISLIIIYWTFSLQQDPKIYLVLGFIIAPGLLVWLDLGKDTFRIVLLSSIPVVVAMWLLPFMYGGVAFALFGSPAYLSGLPFVLFACILAPFMEELVKGSIWLLDRGGWRTGAAVGLGFGCFEAASYMMAYGLDVFFIRWQGTLMHFGATALMFEGLSMGKKKLVVASVLLHVAHNSGRILISCIS